MSKNKKRSRPSGKNRTNLVLGVVKTDSSFELISTTNESIWVGKCIHCNRKIAVSVDGMTGASLEHVMPLTAGGSPDDLRNLALACKTCNNEKGIDHDPYVGRGGRADEVVTALQGKRLARWRDINVNE